MKVLLIYPYGHHGGLPPLGILYLATVLRKEHDVKVIDVDVDKMSIRDIVQNALEYKPHIVGISCMTLQVPATYEIATAIKMALPETTVIVGGPHPSAVKEEMLKECQAIDILVVGEGEITLSQLCSSDRSEYANIPGIIYREGQDIIHTSPRGYISDLDSIPFPAHDLNGDPSRYRHFPEMPMMISRGCPFSCTFCSSPVWGKHYRDRSPENIAGEMEWLIKMYNIKSVFFFIDTFNVRSQFVFDLCDELCHRGLHKKVTWRTECRANQKLVSKELFEAMKEAGCYLVAFGIESANQRILNSVKKALRIQEVENAIRLAKQAGLRTKGYFMIGNLSDDVKSVFETIAFTKKVRLDEAQFTVFTPFPGSADYNTAKKKGWILNDNYELYNEHSANLRTDKLLPSDMEVLRDLACSEFSQESVIRHLLQLLKRRRWRTALKLAKFAILLSFLSKK